MKSSVVGFTLGMVLMAGAASAEPPSPAVAVQEEGGGVYRVTAAFEVAEPAAVVWAVLTDYAGIPEFIPDIRVSIVHEHSGGRARVEQEAVSRFLLFSKRVYLLLDIHEDGDVIRFRDASGRSFAEYAGFWQVARKEGRTEVTYELTAKPTFDVPPFLISRVLGRDATAMIDHLRTEIARRARAAHAAEGQHQERTLAQGARP